MSFRVRPYGHPESLLRESLSESSLRNIFEYVLTEGSNNCSSLTQPYDLRFKHLKGLSSKKIMDVAQGRVPAATLGWFSRALNAYYGSLHSLEQDTELTPSEKSNTRGTCSAANLPPANDVVTTIEFSNKQIEALCGILSSSRTSEARTLLSYIKGHTKPPHAVFDNNTRSHSTQSLH